MNRHLKRALVVIAVLALVFALSATAFAADGAASNENDVTAAKAIASGIAIALAAGGGAIAMGITSGKAAEAIARQPEAAGEIRTSSMLGLVFIETAIIYGLLTVILIIFVL